MLDATSSMEKLSTPTGQELWRVVKESLCSAIDAIEDPNTEVVVAPFIEEIIDVW